MERTLKVQSKYEVYTPSGWKDFEGVSKITKNFCFHFFLENGIEIKTSNKHKIDTPNGYVYAEDLSIDDGVLTSDGVYKITQIEIEDGDIDLYDLLEVKEERHRFYANDLVVSNCAFVPKNIWDDFYASVYPTISSAKTTKVIMVSTPKGKNHFYKMWTESEQKINTFHPTKVYWHEVPGRDEEWERETRANIGNQRFEQEFNISFLGSSNTLISMSALERLVFKQPLNKTGLHEKFPEHLKEMLKVYELPKQGRIYSLGVDSSKMSEDIQGDPCHFQVFDITTIPFKQVCVFKSSYGFSYYEAPELIELVGLAYNKATVFVENNEIGQEVADSLWRDFEYEDVFFEKGNLPGFRTTKKTKRIGCVNLRTFIENEKLDICDFDTISQLSTFAKNKNSYAAEHGYEDDAVMALLASIFFLQVPQFNHFEDRKEFLQKLLERKNGLATEENMTAVSEEVPSFGFTPESIKEDLSVF